MNKKWLLGVGLFILSSSVTNAQINPLWLRYPSISPDGKMVLFGYKGNLYKVATSGGEAIPLTIGASQDMMPVWSHDGKKIAFASNRYGNFDVFVISVDGGDAVRVTTNSANDFPVDFTPDNSQVLFVSSRNAPAKSIRFSSGLFKNLYTVSTSGGRPFLVSAAGTDIAHYNSDGSKIIFQDVKGYEDNWRKHHTSAVTKDIWVLDVKGKTYSKVSDYEGEDREPVFAADNNSFFYLSEKKGSFNVFQKDLSGNSETQLTHFDKNPVRNLSCATDNTICFTYDGEIYTMNSGAQPQKLSIKILNENRENTVTPLSVGNISDFALSPNGKEIAFITRGEVFVSSVEGRYTKRITNTPQQERMVTWSPDGKSLVYAAERGNSWDILRTKIVSNKEPYFFNASLLKEDTLVGTLKDEFQPMFSPDGKKLAYVEERNVLKVMTLATKSVVTLLPEGHNHSYSDGDWSFSWSPDSRYVMMDDQNGYFLEANAAMVKSDGTGKIQYPISSGFGEHNTKWGMNGKMFTWESSKWGRKSLATQGSAEMDIYAAFFDPKDYEKYLLTEDDFKLLQEKEGSDKKDTVSNKEEPSITFKGAKAASMPAEKKVANVEPRLDNLDERTVKLTINSSSISDYVLNKDASKLYYLSEFEKGFDLWVTDPRTHETKILAKLGSGGSGLEITKDDKYIITNSNGNIVKIETASGRVTSISTQGEMELDNAAERKYIFEHAWRQVTKKFYDPTLHGIDWVGYKKTYEKFLPYINNNYDFQELLSELLGELNGSHTGGRFYTSSSTGDNTASLGLLYDETFSGNGLKVDEIIAGGPFDLSNSKMKTGAIITKIDGVALSNQSDWATLLNRKGGRNVLVSFVANGIVYNELVKAIIASAEVPLMYKRWTKREAKLVDSLSGGKIGYVHVQGMNDESFRETYDRVMGKEREKNAIIVDTRFNGGGWLHDDLNTLLSGKNYLRYAPQGNLLKGGEPAVRWQKPSCVLMSEGNYSDAFMFPYSYKEQNIGKLIGMPVAGTGTAVWWERQIDPSIVFGIPMVASIGKENRPTENLQLEPDIKVNLKYEDFLKGDDEQLRAAVNEMLQESK